MYIHDVPFYILNNDCLNYYLIDSFGQTVIKKYTQLSYTPTTVGKGFILYRFYDNNYQNFCLKKVGKENNQPSVNIE